MKYGDTKWLRENCKAKGSQMGLLFVLVTYSDTNGVAFPSEQTLAHLMGYSVKHVRRWLQQLEEHGDLTIEPPRAGLGRRHNVYRLRMPKVRTGVPCGDDGQGTPVRRHGTSVRRTGDTGAPKVRADVPLSIREPSESSIHPPRAPLMRKKKASRGSRERPTTASSEMGTATSVSDELAKPTRADDVVIVRDAYAKVIVGKDGVRGLRDGEVRKLLGRHPVGWWLDVFAKVEASEFLRGVTAKRGFFVRASWLLKPGNAERIASDELGDHQPRETVEKMHYKTSEQVDAELKAGVRQAEVEQRVRRPHFFLQQAWDRGSRHSFGSEPPTAVRTDPPITADEGTAAVQLHPLEELEELLGRIPLDVPPHVTLSYLLLHPEEAERLAGDSTAPEAAAG